MSFLQTFFQLTTSVPTSPNLDSVITTDAVPKVGQVISTTDKPTTKVRQLCVEKKIRAFITQFNIPDENNK